MEKLSAKTFRFALLPFLIISLFAACAKETAAPDVSGIWRSEDALAAKNLVIEFVPGGKGEVFSGSIIGFPTDASFAWQQDGDEINITTQGDDPVKQTLKVLSQEDNKLTVEVNRTKFLLVRVDDVTGDDAPSADSLP